LRRPLVGAVPTVRIGCPASAADGRISRIRSGHGKIGLLPWQLCSACLCRSLANARVRAALRSSRRRGEGAPTRVRGGCCRRRGWRLGPARCEGAPRDLWTACRCARPGVDPVDGAMSAAKAGWKCAAPANPGRPVPLCYARPSFTPRAVVLEARPIIGGCVPAGQRGCGLHPHFIGRPACNHLRPRLLCGVTLVAAACARTRPSCRAASWRWARSSSTATSTSPRSCAR
jgi:hypothetical protein